MKGGLKVDNSVTLMVRSPLWIFAYWQLSDQTKKEFKGIPPVIKINNLTEDSHYFINTNESADNWHIKVGKPNNTFEVELGYIVNGDFKALAGSNKVTTPRNSVSDNWAEYYKIFRSDVFKMLKYLEKGVTSPGSKYLQSEDD